MDDLFVAKCGKTRRAKNSGEKKKNATIDVSRHVHYTNTYSNQVSNVPITPIDNILSYTNDRHAINTQEKWENLIDELEKECVSKKKTYDRYDQSYDIRYSVPATNMLITNDCGNTKYSVNTDNWFEHNGKLYDPKKLYEIENLGNLKIKELRSMNDTDIVEELKPLNGDKKINKILTTTDDKHRFYRYSGSSIINHINFTRPEFIKEEITFKFKKPHYLTHIRLFGDYIQYNIYPPRENRYDRKPQPYIYHARNLKETPYVTLFNLYTKSEITKKWILIDKFAGTFTPLFDVIIDLQKYDLFCQQVRIEPLEWNVSPGFRASFYGIADADADKDNKNNNADNADNELVDYILTIGKNTDWKHDGEYRVYSPEWVYRGVISRKKQMKQYFLDEKKYAYEDNDFSDIENLSNSDYDDNSDLDEYVKK